MEVLKNKPHPLFTRAGEFLTQKVTLKQARNNKATHFDGVVCLNCGSGLKITGYGAGWFLRYDRTDHYGGKG